MVHHYSIVIHPQDSIIDLFKSFKNKLYNTIGNYGSYNSIAHITILEFDATDEELRFIIEKLERITLKEISFDAVFDKVICSDSSKTIFVLPNKNGNEILKKLLIKIRKQIKGDSNKSNAHLTIGRKLKPEHLKKLKNIFSDIKFDFHCNRIALRKLDENIGQFEIIKIFPFHGKSCTETTEQLFFEF